MQLVNGSSTTRTDVYRLLYSNPLGWLSIAVLGGFFYVKITWNNMRRGYGCPICSHSVHASPLYPCRFVSFFPSRFGARLPIRVHQLPFTLNPKQPTRLNSCDGYGKAWVFSWGYPLPKKPARLEKVPCKSKNIQATPKPKGAPSQRPCNPTQSNTLKRESEQTEHLKRGWSLTD